MKGRPASWTEVASYLLSIETGEQHADLSRLGREALEELLEEHFETGKTGCRAAKILREEGPYEWYLREVELGPLRIRYGEPLPALQGEPRPTVRQMREAFEATPETKRSKRLLRYTPRKVPQRIRVLIAYRDKGVERLADGYHRAVSMYADGERMVTVYFGEPPA